jgi:hypothetical protein
MTSPDPDLGAAWERFKTQRQRELDGWLGAERTLAGSHGSAVAPGARGDALLAAEATLQRAIVDFAASEGRHGDPTALALELLRLAEGLLHEPAPARKTRRAKG